MHAVSIAMSLVSNSRGWDTPVVIWLKCFDTHIFHYDVRFIAVNDGTNGQRENGENFSALRSLFNKKRSSCLYLMTYYLGLIYFLCKHSKKRTQPRRHGTGGDVEYKMPDVCPLVIPKHMRTNHTFQLRIKVGKKLE